MSEWLSAAFVTELEALRRRLEIRARSQAPGERTARRRGGSSEFQEHRPYGVGDDLRRIDWAAYARTDEPVVKVFRAEEDVVVRVLLDTSASLDFAAFDAASSLPKKSDVARRLAAAIGYLALARSERAELHDTLDPRAGPRTARRGRGGVSGFLSAIGAVEVRGAASIAASIDAIVRRSMRPGMIAVVSDFLDGGPVLQALARARTRGHDLALLHVVAPDEISPPIEGDLELEDAEGGPGLSVSIDRASVDAYIAALEAWTTDLRNQARRLGATYVRARTDEDLERVMRRFVARALD